MLILPVCGHSNVCVACYATLRARSEAERCPQCRAPLSELTLPPPPPCVDADADADAAGSFVCPEARLRAMLRLCRREELATLPDGSAAASADASAALSLPALAAFATHSDEQRELAVHFGVVPAVCAAMRAAPLSAAVQAAGCAALDELASGCGCGQKRGSAARAVLHAQLKAERACDVAAHALRLLTPSVPRADGDGPGLVVALKCMHRLLTAAFPNWSCKRAGALCAATGRLALAHAAAAHDSPVAGAALELLLLLADNAPDQAAVNCLVADGACLLAALAAFRSRAVGLALKVVQACYSDFSGAPADASAHAALAAGAVPALVAFIHNCAGCVCQNCASALAAALPLLGHVMNADPAVALPQALEAGLMDALTETSHAFANSPDVLREIFRLVARCCAPAPAPGWRFAGASTDGAEARWHMPCDATVAATAAAAAAAAATPLAQRALTCSIAFGAATQSSRAAVPRPEWFAVEVDRLFRCSGQALLAASALLARGDAHFENVLLRHISVDAFSEETMQRLRDQLLPQPGEAMTRCCGGALAPLPACATCRTPALSAGSRIMNALLRRPRDGAASQQCLSDAAAHVRLVLLCTAECPCRACDAAAAEACELLAQMTLVATSVGQSATVAALFKSGVLPALFAAMAEHPLKPALRRAAPRALALALGSAHFTIRLAQAKARAAQQQQAAAAAPAPAAAAAVAVDATADVVAAPMAQE
jgi:hypothetical protein